MMASFRLIACIYVIVLGSSTQTDVNRWHKAIPSEVDRLWKLHWGNSKAYNKAACLATEAWMAANQATQETVPAVLAANTINEEVQDTVLDTPAA